MSEGIWETDCGNAHEFFADGPEQNGYKFCPYCGRRIVVIESETYWPGRKEDLYPGSWQAEVKHGTTTIRPEFPVHYDEGSDAMERRQGCSAQSRADSSTVEGGN